MAFDGSKAAIVAVWKALWGHEGSDRSGWKFVGFGRNEQVLSEV